MTNKVHKDRCLGVPKQERYDNFGLLLLADKLEQYGFLSAATIHFFRNYEVERVTNEEMHARVGMVMLTRSIDKKKRFPIAHVARSKGVSNEILT